jgi:hypothetical protein
MEPHQLAAVEAWVGHSSPRLSAERILVGCGESAFPLQRDTVHCNEPAIDKAFSDPLVVGSLILKPLACPWIS